MTLLSIVELALIWSQSTSRKETFYLAAILAAVSPLAFIILWLGRRIIVGTLSDPNGTLPLRVTLFGAKFVVDLNLAAVVAALISLPVILSLY